MSAALSSPTLERLDDQINWYDRKSGTNQHWYKGLKIVTISAALLIPILSVAAFGKYYAGALGIVIALAEGLQQLNQFQVNWVAYRSTCEALRHEKYLYLASAGPYAASPNPLQLLAERIEGMVSQEHAKWVSAQQETGGKPQQPQQN